MGIGAPVNASARAVFLDRDGVVNRAVVRDGKPYPPASLAEMEIVEDAAASLSRLKNLGFLLLVVTNQPDVARGRQTIDAIQAMHDVLRKTLPIDGFLVCPHDDRDGCRCRKPDPGLVFEAQQRYGIDLSRSFSAIGGEISMPAGLPAAAPSTSTSITGNADRRPLPTPASHRSRTR